jgi:hypothetical protein
MVRLSGDPLTAVPALRSAVEALDPAARVEGIARMEDVVGRAFAPWRFSSIVVSAFAAIALTFAAVGIAALVAFTVTQRPREIGVRVALGAQTRELVRARRHRRRLDCDGRARNRPARRLDPATVG